MILDFYYKFFLNAIKDKCTYNIFSPRLTHFWQKKLFYETFKCLAIKVTHKLTLIECRTSLYCSVPCFKCFVDTDYVAFRTHVLTFDDIFFQTYLTIPMVIRKNHCSNFNLVGKVSEFLLCVHSPFLWF